MYVVCNETVKISNYLERLLGMIFLFNHSCISHDFSNEKEFATVLRIKCKTLSALTKTFTGNFYSCEAAEISETHNYKRPLWKVRIFLFLADLDTAYSVQ